MTTREIPCDCDGSGDPKRSCASCPKCNDTGFIPVKENLLDNRRFPVLNQQECHPRDRKTMPRSVPWAFAETFREQAFRNHDQTLERLAERGGLAPEEMWLASRGLGLRDLVLRRLDEQQAIDWLYKTLHEIYGEPLPVKE